MIRIVIAALMTCLAAGSVFAQSTQHYYEAVEEHVLEVQAEYLARERELTEPLWVRTKSGDIRIVDGARLRTRLEGLVFVLRSMGLETAALESLSPMMRIAAELAGEEGRADIAVFRVMETLQARSNAVRGEAIGGLDSLLEAVRSEARRTSQISPNVVRTASETYVFEAANYWHNDYRVLRDFTDDQSCARMCAEDKDCKVATFSDHTAEDSWANTCVLRSAVGERHTEQRGIYSWVKPEANAHGGKRCPNGGMIAGVGGDDVYRESFFDGNRSVSTTSYLLEIAPHPKHNGATFQHFFLDGEPFPDADWGVNIATTKIVCN